MLARTSLPILIMIMRIALTMIMVIMIIMVIMKMMMIMMIWGPEAYSRHGKFLIR